MLASGKPLFDQLLDGSLALPHEPTLLVVCHCLPAGGPRLAFRGEAPFSDLATFAGQWVSVTIEEIAVGLSPPLNVAFHAASRRSRSRSRTTKTRPPNRLTGNSPDSAYRYAEARLMPSSSAAWGTEMRTGSPSKSVMPPFSRCEPGPTGSWSGVGSGF